MTAKLSFIIQMIILGIIYYLVDGNLKDTVSLFQGVVIVGILCMLDELDKIKVALRDTIKELERTNHH